MEIPGSGTCHDPYLLTSDEDDDGDIIVLDREIDQAGGDEHEDHWQEPSIQDHLRYQRPLLSPYQEPADLGHSELHSLRFQVLEKALGSEAARTTSRQWLGKRPSSQRGELQAKYSVECPKCTEEVSSDDLRFAVCGHGAHKDCWSEYIRSRTRHGQALHCFMCRRDIPDSVESLFHGSWLRPGPCEMEGRLADDRAKKLRNRRKLSIKQKQRKGREVAAPST